MVTLKKDSKGPCMVLSHERCGITETVFLTEEELMEVGRLIVDKYGIERVYIGHCYI